MNIYHTQHSRGFALVATVSMMVLMTLIAVGMLSLSTIEQRSSGGGVNDADRTARANARMALMIAIGELQKAAGPDQRVTATASILGSATNPYTTGTNAVNGRKHWVGIWDTSEVRRDVDGDGDIDNDDKTVDTNGDGEGDEFPPYSPADPDEKEFVRWLVSGDTYNPGDNLASLVAVSSAPAADDLVIFKGLNGTGILDDNAADSIKVPKVEVATATPGNTSYYAYWVEDEGVKADLAWNEMPAPSFSEKDGDDLPIYPLGEADPQYIADMARWQAARLSHTAGPDYAVFEGLTANSGPFIEDSEDDIEPENHEVTYPLLELSTYDVNADGEITDADNQNPWIANIKKAMSVADIPLVMQDPLVQNTDNHSEWLKANRHHMAMNVRGVMADVKKGGLRRDLSLAFEMDGATESESATLFNQQTTEFVGNGDKLSSPYNMPGVFLNNDPTKPLKARELFRDYNNCWYIPDYTSAGTPFSEDITTTNTVVRGPSWWLLRDYANLYKRLKTSPITDNAGNFLYNTHEFAARPYYPNRTTPGITQELGDIHSDNQENYGYTKIRPNNQEFGTYNGNDVFAYRPLRASYAPVVLGVNNLLSLVYSNNKLQLVVDPFFIIWNPYNTRITAKKFAVTIENGFGGGIRFRVTDANDNVTLHGQEGWIGRGSATTFVDYARNKAGNIGMDLSYLITDLSMDPGEVMFYSPTNDKDRNNDDPANTLHDDLTPGLNYNATDSGIFFDKFPNDQNPDYRSWVTNPQVWDTIPGSNGAAPVIDSDSKIEVLFNIYYRNRSGIANVVETNIPNDNRVANEMINEASYGDQVASHEFRLNARAHGWDTENNFNINHGTGGFSYSFTFDELSTTKTSFAILSMLNTPTDFSGADTSLEVFSQLNVTPTVRSRKERGGCTPLNITVNAVTALDIDNLMNIVGIDLDGFNDGNNAFYGKDYSSVEGDSSFPLIDIPNAPMHSLVQLSGANIGIRLVEPTHAIGNSWRPPYIPMDSIYYNRMNFNDVSWQANDALFDQYYFSGIAPEFTIGAGGYTPAVANTSNAIEDTLQRFYGIDPSDPTQTVDSSSAMANPALEPHVPLGKTSDDVVADLNPNDTQYNTTTNIYDGYKKVGAYSLIKGAFNVNSTSVKAWRAFLQANKALALVSVQDTNDTGTGTPFPLASTTSNTSSNNGWEKSSRLTDTQIDSLATAIVEQVKARGPFMSLSDFVNRRIGNDNRSHQGAIQEAIEQAEINGTYDATTNTYDGIRGSTSDSRPNYSILVDGNRERITFPFTDESYVGNRNNATGIPLEINQANILLPLAPRLSARTDTFRIRAYGEVRDANDNIIAQATCEAIVQRLPEYMDPNTNAPDNEPWDDDSQAPTLNAINQTYGRKFEIKSFRWLDQSEV